LIFRSGSIIITGYKKPTEAKDALDYISNIIIENQEVVLSK
jgi:TATA-box binding protein (TBP) (component of TFIID and TFIIIB)